MFLELNSKGLYQSSGKEKETCCFVFPFSAKREIRHFQVLGPVYMEVGKPRQMRLPA